MSPPRKPRCARFSPQGAEKRLGRPGAFLVRRIACYGFTLIELLVVMAIVSLLLSLAVPRYFNSVEKSKEAVLKKNLAATREILDKYYGDHGKYPDSLDALVSQKYLRALPFDPVADSSANWIVVEPETPDKGKVFDIKSGAAGNARDGTLYKEW